MKSLLLPLMLLVACAKQAQPVAAVPGAVDAPGEVVAMVGQTQLTQPMVDAVLAQMGPDQLAQIEAGGQLPQLIEQLRVAEALYQRAVAEGLHNDPEVALMLAMSTRSALASAYVERQTSAAITDADVQAFYDANGARFANEQVRASHILTDDATAMETVVTALANGGDFAALAKQYSKDPGSGAQGGDLGWFGRNRMVAPFEEVAFASEVGTVSEPFDTRFGTHIVLVTEKRDATPLVEVEEDIRRELEGVALDLLLTEINAELNPPTPADP